MKLNDYKRIFISIGLIGVLFIASFALVNFIHLPDVEHFSELYVLGPNNLAENYPYDLNVGQNYTVNVGVTNHLGSLAYYVLEIKLGNRTDLYPNPATGTPSSLSTLYECRFILQDNQSWESPVNFSILNATFSDSYSLVKTLMINNVIYSVNKSAELTASVSDFSYSLLFELWLYNNHAGAIQYNNRYVELQLNLTKPA